LAKSRVVNKRLDENGIIVVRPDAAEEKLVSELVVSNLNGCRVNIVKNNEISPVKERITLD
jgi:hypothetical protein